MQIVSTAVGESHPSELPGRGGDLAATGNSVTHDAGSRPGLVIEARASLRCRRPIERESGFAIGGETTAASRLARERGYDSLLVVTYWGHVSRLRIYFEHCFDGPVHVMDTPRPLSKSRRDALLHQTGGYFKAFLKPAC